MFHDGFQHQCILIYDGSLDEYMYEKKQNGILQEINMKKKNSIHSALIN